jgi:hypothetical protein
MNPIVALIWWVTLLGAVFAFLPNLVAWLMRVFGAANEIEKYSADILAAAKGIRENTAKAAALKETIAVAPRLVSSAQSIESHAASLESFAAARPAPRRRNPRTEAQP